MSRGPVRRPANCTVVCLYEVGKVIRGFLQKPVLVSTVISAVVQIGEICSSLDESDDFKHFLFYFRYDFRFITMMNLSLVEVAISFEYRGIFVHF